MEIFKTDDFEIYQTERDRRKKIYEKLCSEKIPKDHELISLRIKKLDEAYLDFHDRVIFDVGE